jgi:hypothetical protein
MLQAFDRNCRMKTCVAITAITIACIGCSKSEVPVGSGANALENRSFPERIRPPASTTSPGATVVPERSDAYPEKSEVVAILHRAREMQRKFQFENAMELVSEALEIDPRSPAAQNMQRQLVEMLKKV